MRILSPRPCASTSALTTPPATVGAPTVSAGSNYVIPIGTPFTLTLANSGGTNEDANATGDLDVLSSGGGLSLLTDREQIGDPRQRDREEEAEADGQQTDPTIGPPIAHRAEGSSCT